MGALFQQPQCGQNTLSLPGSLECVRFCMTGSSLHGALAQSKYDMFLFSEDAQITEVELHFKVETSFPLF